MRKKTTQAERNYSSYFLKILAIAVSVKKFRMYLLSIKFKIVTDCAALAKTLTKKDLPPRWALLLEEYDFTIEYRSGTRTKHADTISRYPISLQYLLKHFYDAHISVQKQLLEKRYMIII